jgi:putative iron-only hydrogenase system regulator
MFAGIFFGGKTMENSESRIATISIAVHNRDMAEKINEVLNKHGDVIRGRLGIPYPDRGISIICIVVDADNSRIGAISGALGNINGVTLRVAMVI